MRNMYQMDRRQFFKLLAAVSASMTVSRILPAATIAPRRRRHLINIQSFGGSDACWHWSPLLLSENMGLAQQAQGTPGKPRFDDNSAIALSESSGGGFLGAALGAYTSQDLGRLAVWRGLMAEGSHEVGNRMNENGHLSSYAAAFSVIIADALTKAPDYVRPLHYVMVMNSPSAFYSNPGFFIGPGIPTCVPDATAWSNLSKLDAKDPANNPTLKEALNTAIGKLSTKSKDTMKIPESKDIVANTYQPAYDSSSQILGKNYSAEKEYVDISARYLNDLVADFVSTFLANSSNNPLAAAFTGIGYSGFPTDSNTARSFLQGRYGGRIFTFAVAEFLVKRDLSAVVDIPTSGGDYHTQNHFDLLDGFFTWSCYRSLIRNLANYTTGLASGNLLDRTLVVHSTEFDRTYQRGYGLGAPQDGLSIGTNHGSTSTYVLAGYRVNAGKVFGRRMTTKDGALGSLGSGLVFEGPVPLDTVTGQPSATGFMYTQRAFAPTVLNLFGLTVPSQQVTEQKAAKFLEKPGSPAY